MSVAVQSREHLTPCIRWTVTQGKTTSLSRREWTDGHSHKGRVSSASANALYLYTLTAYREAALGIPCYQFIHLALPLLGRDSPTKDCLRMHYGFSKCLAPGDTRERACARARASRGKMRGCLSPGSLKGKKRKRRQTKQWLPWRHQSSVSGLLKGSGLVVRVTWHADNR